MHTRWKRKYLQEMLEVDDGPELGAEFAIIEVPRLVVRPISEVRGIPVGWNFCLGKGVFVVVDDVSVEKSGLETISEAQKRKLEKIWHKIYTDLCSLCK